MDEAYNNIVNVNKAVIRGGNNMKKVKLIVMMLTVAISVSVFAGCASKAVVKNQDSSNKETVTLKLWGAVPPEYGPQEVVDNFNKEFKDKGIQVEYTRFVNDDQGNLKLDTGLLAGGDLDLYMSYGMDTLKKRASGKMAMDLSSFIEKDKFDMVKNFGNVIKDYNIDGKTYAVPETSGNPGILLNKDMFDAAGIKIPTSWTYDEFRAIAKKLTKGEGQDKTYGMFFNTVQQANYAVGFVGSTLGGDGNYKAGGKESNFDNAIFEKNLQLTSDMMNVDKSAVTHIDTATQKLTIEGLFLTGKVAMSIGVWSTRSIKDTAKYPHTFMTAYAPYPTVDKTPAKYTSGGLGDFISINPKSKYTQEAWDFIKWYSEKGSLPMAKYGRVPSSKNVDKAAILKVSTQGAEKLLDKKSYEAIMVKSYPNYGVPTITNKIAELSKVLNEECEATLTNQKTAKQAMASAKKRSDDLLKQ